MQRSIRILKPYNTTTFFTETLMFKVVKTSLKIMVSQTRCIRDFCDGLSNDLFENQQNPIGLKSIME